VIAALAGLVIPFSQIGSARAAEAGAAGGGPKPIIVLVHGAWADTSSWDGVIRRLQADGYTVYAPPDPLRGLPYDSAYLADFLHSISSPIVLVGHSYGGAVITNAATGDPQVKALVYVDAFAPAQGQTLEQLLASVPGSCAVPANLNVVPFPGAPAGVGEAYIKQSVFPSCMADGLPAAEARVLAVTQLPVDAPHLSMVSDPGTVTNVILQAVRATS
jgi:pimeloyl-ACP methyl ester carboxylesterase